MAGWEGVSEFVAVAETESFTAAARRLGTSVAHVSRQVGGPDKHPVQPLDRQDVVQRLDLRLRRDQPFAGEPRDRVENLLKTVVIHGHDHLLLMCGPDG